MFTALRFSVGMFVSLCLSTWLSVCLSIYVREIVVSVLVGLFLIVVDGTEEDFLTSQIGSRCLCGQSGERQLRWDSSSLVNLNRYTPSLISQREAGRATTAAAMLSLAASAAAARGWLLRTSIDRSIYLSMGLLLLLSFNWFAIEDCGISSWSLSSLTD